MATRPIWKLSVQSKQQLTPNMQRLILQGDSLRNFPEDQEGGYVKLLLPSAPGQEVAALGLEGSIKRSYTVRACDRNRGTLILDAVSHHDGGGPATAWVGEAKAGDAINVTGPGPVERLVPDVDWVFLAGDMTALPAMAVNLERLPKAMKGHAVVAIYDEADAQDLERPEGVEVHWVVSPAPSATSPLVKKVRALEWYPGRASVWSASEFSEMKALRSYFRDERGVPAELMYISSYWKAGASDEEHKVAKRLEG